MRLEDLTIALRPRQPWEAVDLGCTLVRRDYGAVLGLWLISTVPLWIVLAILLWDYPAWFAASAWWLKPLYDRLPLYYLSRAAFGAKPTFKQALREWPRLWSKFLFSALILRRLSLIRSFAMPVLMLEGQRGRAANKRVRALAIDGGSSGSTLTWVFIKLEIAVWLGLTALMSSVGPESGLPDWGEMFQNPETFFETSLAQQWLANVVYLTAITLMEPFYVGAGFGLYLNSRTKIEGWDVELTFRRLAERLKPVAMAILAAGCFLAPLVQAQDQESITTPAPTEGVEAVVKEILAEPEFEEHSRTQKVWMSDAESSSNDSGDQPWLGALLTTMGLVIVGFLLFLAIRWIIQNRHIFGFSSPARIKLDEPPPPRVVMGLDIARESLPEDIVTAARQAWSAGHLREALSLLYRGSLSRLVEQNRLPIRDSDTEDDCLMHVANIGEAGITHFFRQLTLLWVRAAYAGQEAQHGEFDQLCQAWPFSNAPVKPGRQRLFASTAVALFALFLMTGCKGHWEEVTIPLGYRGAARLDPFLAAQRLLQEYDHHTERLPALKEMPYSEEGVIILSAEAGMPEGRAQQLLDWVQDGGHLIYAMAGCAPYNDWGLFSSLNTFAYPGNEDRQDPVLERLGVKLEGLHAEDGLGKKKKKQSASSDDAKPEESEDKAPEDAKKAEPEPESKTTPDDPGAKKPKIKEPEDVPTSRGTIHIGDETYYVDFPDQLRLSLDRKLRRGEFAAESKDKTMALSLHYGSGRVTVLNHARPLRNRYLDENDHARWLLALIGEEPRHVQFIVSMQQSFWGLLWKKAWMPLIGLGLLVLIWLWMNLPRFGPLQQVVLHDTKHFSEHIGALGQFFHRLRRPDVLLLAAADAVRARAIRSHPHLVHQDDSALIDLLSERTDLSKDRIRAAFVPHTGKVAGHDMVRLLQDLQTLKKALG